MLTGRIVLIGVFPAHGLVSSDRAIVDCHDGDSLKYSDRQLGRRLPVSSSEPPFTCDRLVPQGLAWRWEHVGMTNCLALCLLAE